MKLQLITEILGRAGIEPVGREVLMRLAGTPEGRRFQQALLAVDAGDAGQRTHLVNIISNIESSSAPAMPAANLGRRPSSSQVSQTTGKPAPPYFNFSIYSGSAALCISKANVRSTGQHTIQVEAAAVLTGGPRRAFDWANKITVQLNEQEMLQALALFEGKIDAVEFLSHGQAHDKFMRARRQDHAFFVEVGQRGRSLHGAPVSAADAFRITSLAYEQIMANSPHLNLGIVSNMLNQVASMHQQPVSRRPAQR